MDEALRHRLPPGQTGLSSVGPGFLAGGGEMASRIKAFNWSSTPLGPLDAWPAWLKIIVGTLLPSPAPQALLWGEKGVLIYNDAYSSFAADRDPGLLGISVLAGWPEAADFNQRVLDVCLRGGSLSFQDQPLVLYRHGKPTNFWLNLDYSPVRDENGHVRAVLAIVVDNTKTILAEQALAKSKERLSQALQAAGMVGTWDWNIQTDTIYADARFAALYGVDPDRAEQGTGLEAYLAGIHPDDMEPVQANLRRAIALGETYDQEYRVLQADGGMRWVHARGECIYDPMGEPLRFPGAAVDITERKEAEEARRLVLRELNHRVKNLFAVVSGMVTMTARSTATPQEMASSLRGRLNALAQAHELIRSAVVENEEQRQSAQLEALMRAVVAPHLQHERQAVMGGPDVQIGTQVAASLALVLHELATNAAKYGALSGPGGTLHVAWETREGELRLTWTENGGPAIESPPERKGFGSQLMRMSVTGQLGGQISHEWRREGVRISLSASLERMGR